MELLAVVFAWERGVGDDDGDGDMAWHGGCTGFVAVGGLTFSRSTPNTFENNSCLVDSGFPNTKTRNLGHGARYCEGGVSLTMGLAVSSSILSVCVCSTGFRAIGRYDNQSCLVRYALQKDIELLAHLYFVSTTSDTSRSSELCAI